MDAHRPLPPKLLPTTKTLRWSLFGVALFYLSFGVAGIVFLKLGGYRWNGNTNTLTTVLAVLGAIFTFMSRSLISYCQDAALQRLAGRAIESSVSLNSLHHLDVALHGSITMAMRNRWGLLFRGLLPLFAILMSAAFKKAFGTGIESVATTIRGTDASFVDPTHVGSGIRGTLFAGAIVYNTTTSIGSGLSPGQTSWTYMAADTNDLSGLNSVQYFMPNLPQLVAAGSAGYTSYNATSVPALAVRVQCSATQYTITNPYGSIENSNNEIFLDYFGRTPVIQVVSTQASWSCLAYLGMTNGTVNYVSDSSGNWNISSVSMSAAASLDFLTTPVRWDMMADIISDALGTTAGYSAWDWDKSTSKSAGYSNMLVSTRLSFAAAILAFSESRSASTATGVTGVADQPIQKIVLNGNWALVMTTVLLLLQALVPSVQLFSLGIWKRTWKLDFGILQTMEMRAAAAITPLPLWPNSYPATADAGIRLHGHCSKIRDDVSDDRQLAIRSNGPPEWHLGFVRCENGRTPEPWVYRVDGKNTYS